MTGVDNRRYFEHFLRVILDKAKVQRFPVTLLLFDIDDFKRYNDTYGHGVGDQILKETAALMERFRPHRLAARARKETFRLGSMALELPYQLHDTLEQVRDGQIEVGFVHKGLDDLLNRMDVVFNRLVIAMIVAGGLIGSSLIGIFAKAGPHLLGINVISVLGFAFSGLLGMWLLWGVVRSGRL